MGSGTDAIGGVPGELLPGPHQVLLGEAGRMGGQVSGVLSKVVEVVRQVVSVFPKGGSRDGFHAEVSLCLRARGFSSALRECGDSEWSYAADSPQHSLPRVPRKLREPAVVAYGAGQRGVREWHSRVMIGRAHGNQTSFIRRKASRTCFSVSTIAKSAPPTPTTSTPSQNGTGSVEKTACKGGR